jgi:hypothetical protein
LLSNTSDAALLDLAAGMVDAVYKRRTSEYRLIQKHLKHHVQLLRETATAGSIGSV